jgi:hypothetical protein
MSRIDKVIDEAAKRYGIPRSRIFCGIKGDIRLTAARAKITYELKNSDKPLSFSQIGKILKLDHSSCIHLFKRMVETNGNYYDEKLNKVCRATKRIHSKNNQRYKLIELNKKFARGIMVQSEAL